MNTMQENKTEKNITVSILKLIAACAVIFLHINFAGRFGEGVECIARIAVPVFFAISGYYSFGIKTDVIKRRLIKVLKIFIAANSIYLIWNMFLRCYLGDEGILDYLKTVFSIKNLATVFLMDGSLTSFHLWYLTAMLYVYIIYLIYCSFWKDGRINYKYLYIYSAMAFVVLILFALKVQAVNIGEFHWVYRNSLFFGIPLFSMGIFIHEYRERIMNNYFFQNKTVTFILFTVSILLGLLQYFGIGKTDYPVMLTYAIFVLVLYTTNSNITANVKNPDQMCSLINRTSMIIYIIHILVRDIFTADYDHNRFFGEISQNSYTFPLIVLLASIVIAFIISAIDIYFLNPIFSHNAQRGTRK